jgi:MFS family permease
MLGSIVPKEVRHLLKNRNFLLILLNTAFQQVAYNIVNFASVIWVFKLTGANIAVSLWALALLIPSVSLSLVSGILADNYDRRKIMIGANLLWSLAVFGFVFARESFVAILALTLVIQGIDELFVPSQASSLPRVVKGKELLAANSFLVLILYCAILVGFLLAGPLLRFLGYPAPFVVASLLVVLGAAAISFLPPIKTKQLLGRSPQTSSLSLLKKEFRKQLSVFMSKREIFVTGLSWSFLSGLMSAAAVVAPGFMEQSLGIAAEDISFIGVVPLACGLVLGALLIGRFGNRFGEEKMIKRGLFSFGSVLATAAFCPLFRPSLSNGINRIIGYAPRLGIEQLSLPFETFPAFSLLVGLLIFFLGVAAAFVAIPIWAVLQRITPDNVRGKTFGVFAMITSFLTALLILSSGVIADLFDPAPMIALAGLAIAVFAFKREAFFGSIFDFLKANDRLDGRR